MVALIRGIGGTYTVEYSKRNQIAKYLNIGAKQHSSFYKFLKGGFPCPKFIEKQAEQIVVRLTKLLEKPDQALLKDSRVKKIIEDDYLPIIHTVFIPFDIDLPVTTYYNPDTPVPSIQTDSQIAPGSIVVGIVTYNNTSRYEADGEIYVAQIRMATDIDPGTSLSIKRINKQYWHTDRYYIIIDRSYQISIHELMPGDDENTVRLVSSNYPGGPHKIYHLDNILAIFRIVDGNCIPKPKRNIVYKPITALKEKTVCSNS